jgi:hypothetical protein
LGSHRGHPVTVIARTTLAELNQAAHAVGDPHVPMPGPARTGGNTVLPMRDLIRMAADSIHYLVVFDDHSERPIYPGRQTRIANDVLAGRVSHAAQPLLDAAVTNARRRPLGDGGLFGWERRDGAFISPTPVRGISLIARS